MASFDVNSGNSIEWGPVATIELVLTWEDEPDEQQIMTYENQGDTFNLRLFGDGMLIAEVSITGYTATWTDKLYVDDIQLEEGDNIVRLENGSHLLDIAGQGRDADHIEAALDEFWCCR